MTGQIVEFLQGKDLNALTSGTAGGFPVQFYLDGAAVLRALRPRGGYALEVVYPGPQFQHGFYRDDNGEADQKSIIDHVVGHNNFAFMSGLEHYRAGQGLMATKELDSLLKGLYSSYNKDEVQRFYLWSLTMARLMDWYAPYHQKSKEFEPAITVQADPLGRSRPSIERHPRSPTENVLPAFAANMAQHQPPWKRKILELLHTSQSFRPALVHTQIMNEGWASIMQEIIPPHSKNHKTFEFWLNASQVMQREARPNLKDPYSLGVFCWRNLRAKFFKRPEIVAMKELVEKDRAFIKWANESVISKMTDEQFLRLAMDQEFVDRFQLAIVRRAEQAEWDPNLPQPPVPPGTPPPAQWIIVSRQAEKVVQAIIDDVIKPKYQWNPRARLVDFNRPGSGEVELKIDDAFGNSLAMEQSSLTPSLYAMANIIDKPVSLEANIALKEYAQVEIPDPWAHVRPYPLPPRYETKEVYKLHKIRVVVAPNGEAKIFRRKDNGVEEFDKDLTAHHLQKFLVPYIEDLFLDDQMGLQELLANNPELNAMVTGAVAKMVDGTPYDSLVAQNPNAAGAILEYKDMVAKRMVRAMELAAQGKRNLVVQGGNIRIRALPQEMHLSFDMEHVNAVYADTKGARPDVSLVNRTQRENNTLEMPFGDFQGGDGKIGGIDGNPGDKFWGPGNPPPGESGGPKPGEDPNDLSWVEIPADLYSKFLGERVKLPILNRKPGLSRTKKMKPGRRINRRQGQALPSYIIENAYARGYVKELGEGRDPSEDPDRTMDVGLESLLNRDWVVRSKVVTKKPDTKVVVNFVLDMSGSTARYMEAFKRFVHDMETLIRANYQGFDFRYIVFDTEAHVMKNRDEFFRAALGGGTYYSKGIEKAHELFNEKYPRANWDRYTFLMGDMEDFNPDDAMNKIMKLLEESEYFGVVAGLHSAEFTDWLQLLTKVRAEAATNPAMGLTILNDDGTYSIDNIREVLKNEDEQK